MADDWWSNFLEILFGSPATGHVGVANAWYPAAQQAGQDVVREVDRQEQAATQQATPTPPPQATTRQAPNPNARDDERLAQKLNEALGSVPVRSELYGSLPQGSVYLGHENKQRGNGNWYKADKTDSVQDVLADLNTWSEKKRRKFAEMAVDAGLLKEVTVNYDDLEPVLGKLALRSAKLYEHGIRETPWGLLGKYAKAGTAPGAASSGPITTTAVNRTVNLTSPRDANALVDAALQQRLGRSPTDKEKKEFLAALNAAEKKEPSVTKTTTTTTGSGTENVSTSSSSTTSGGVDTSNFAREWSMSHNKEEAGSYQALAFYMPLFYQALGAAV